MTLPSKPRAQALLGGTDLALTPREQLLVDAIANRFIELQRAQPASTLVDARALAHALGVSRETIYAHAATLGGRRVGDGPRGRLRFDRESSLRAWSSRSSGESPETIQPGTAGRTTRRDRQRAGSSAELLPIRDSRVPTDTEGS
jgi:hypothetical protein